MKTRSYFPSNQYVMLGHVPSDKLTHILQTQNIYVMLPFLACFVVVIDVVSLEFALHPYWNISITGFFFFFLAIFHNLFYIQDQGSGTQSSKQTICLSCKVWFPVLPCSLPVAPSIDADKLILEGEPYGGGMLLYYETAKRSIGERKEMEKEICL